MSAEQARWRQVPAPALAPVGDGYAVDPYLAWVALAGFDNIETVDDQGVVPVLVEQHPSLRWSSRQLRMLELERVPGVKSLWGHMRPPWLSAPCSRFQTAMVPVALLAALALMVRIGLVARFQLGAVRGRPARVQELHEVQPFAPAPVYTLGVIDDGCCLAHEAFRDGSKSHLMALWDQNPDAAVTPPWRRYVLGRRPTAPYGAEMRYSDINDVLAKHPGLGTKFETECYRAVYPPRDGVEWLGTSRSHGAAVMHLLAGLRPRGPNEPDATKMPLIFVQLPRPTVADSSGGSLGFHVLDGVRYIVRRTREVAQFLDWHTVINISFGSIAGCHDGNSITEQALDELVRKFPGKIDLVIAAGNAAGRRIHATRAIGSGTPQAQRRFLVMVPPANTRESYVEFWIPPADARSGAVNDPDRFSVSVSTPDGLDSGPVRAGRIVRLGTAVHAQAAIVFARKVAQSTQGTMILLAIRPTSRLPGDTRAVAPSGIWTIELQSRQEQPAEIHAWVERDDTVVGTRRGQQARFVHDDCLSLQGSYINDASTLGSIANGQEVVVVGAYDVASARVASYSGQGPVRLSAYQDRPQVYGPSDRSPSTPGLEVPGFFSGTRQTLSGTSAAAPRVARWIAEGLSIDEIRRIDSQGDNGSGHLGIKPAPE